MSLTCTRCGFIADGTGKTSERVILASHIMHKHDHHERACRNAAKASEERGRRYAERPAPQGAGRSEGPREE